MKTTPEKNKKTRERMLAKDPDYYNKAGYRHRQRNREFKKLEEFLKKPK